jgi:hypothetical protein
MHGALDELAGIAKSLHALIGWVGGRAAWFCDQFDDDRRVRVQWQTDTRLRYVDEIPYISERYRWHPNSWLGGVNDG